jgi:hypothetical protein
LFEVVARFYHQVRNSPTFQLSVNWTLSVLFNNGRWFSRKVIFQGLTLVRVFRNSLPFAACLRQGWAWKVLGIIGGVNKRQGNSVLLCNSSALRFIESVAVKHAVSLLFGFLPFFGINAVSKLLFQVPLDIDGVLALLAVERFGKCLVNLVNNFLSLFRLWTFHWLHFGLNCLFDQLQLFLLSVKLDPNWEGRPFFGGENAAFPHAQYRVHSKSVFEKWNVNRGREFFVDSVLDQVVKQVISFRSINWRNVLTDGDHVVPERRCFHESIIAVLFFSELVQYRRWIGRRIGVSGGAVSKLIEVILALSDAFFVVESRKKWEIFLLGHHSFGKFDSGESILAVNGHFGKELLIDKRIDFVDGLIFPVEGKGVEIKVDRMGKIEISRTGVENDFD